jgi:putative aldouronate transport system substrate-binding protein
VPGATLSSVVPYAQGLNAKPNQTFQADNLVVVNADGGDLSNAMKLQDWVSIKDNHDLVEYGIEGKDWKSVGDDTFQALSQYTTFPGFALCWRTTLERKASYMTPSEEKVFAWAQSYDSFTEDPLASFVPDTKPVQQEIAAMSSVITQYANPLFYGVVDVNPQLDKLKKAAAAAGLNKLQAEMEKQANAYLAKKS